MDAVLGTGRNTSVPTPAQHSPSPDLPSHETSHALLQALGVPAGASNRYIGYVCHKWPGEGTIDGFFTLFTEVVEYFKGDPHHNRHSINSYINTYADSPTRQYFSGPYPNERRREEAVKSTVLLLLGIWTFMENYFVRSYSGERWIVQAYCTQTKKPYCEETFLNESIHKILSECPLLPNENETVASENNIAVVPSPFAHHASIGFSRNIFLSRKLNASKLYELGAVEICWTENISRHLLLSKHGPKNYLELFTLPGAICGDDDPFRLETLGFQPGLMKEIRRSYANLFNPAGLTSTHGYLLHLFCWCLSCSAKRLRDGHMEASGMGRSHRQEYDQDLKNLMESDAADWKQTDFPNLWPRITILDAHLQSSKPWKFSVIFKDKRDTVQYWTFLFGTIILVLTVIQVSLGLAQVVGSS